MRLVVARCEVDYTGRLSAHLPMATRLIMVKADGCVAVHSDEGAYKPLNWMTAPNYREEREGEWVVTNRAGERLVIRFEEVLSDDEYPLGAAPGLAKDGVEAELQRLLAEAPFVLEPGLSLLRREYPTDLGPVDLLCRNGFVPVVYSICADQHGQLMNVNADTAAAALAAGIGASDMVLVTEVPGVVSVTYNITKKPPSTMEAV